MVKTEYYTFNSEELYDFGSKNIILHKHGSLCIATEEFIIDTNSPMGMPELKHRDDPVFLFNPNTIEHRFPFFRRLMSSVSYEQLWERCIAPITHKASNFNKPFFEKVRIKTIGCIRNVKKVVEIGYRFNPLDEGSFISILNEIDNNNISVIITAPDTKEISLSLNERYGYKVKANELTFIEWADKGFNY